MPNIATVLKEEIARLARKELNAQTKGMKKTSAQYRRDIADLRRRVMNLERKVSLLERKVLQKAPLSLARDADARVRFTAKGLRSQRKRLGLSASDYAKLLGVTPQSIYNWERKASRPRKEQIARLATLRGMGKRETLARLRQFTKEKPRAKKKARTKKKS